MAHSGFSFLFDPYYIHGKPTLPPYYTHITPTVYYTYITPVSQPSYDHILLLLHLLIWYLSSIGIKTQVYL